METQEEVQCKIKTLLEVAGSMLPQAQAHLEYINGVDQEKEKKGEKEAIQTKVKEYYDPLIKKLQNEQTEALDEVEKVCNNDRKKIWSRQSELQDVVSNYNKARSDSESVITTSTNEQQVIREGQAIIALLQKVIKTQLKLEDTESLEMESRKYNPPTSECLGKLELVKTEPKLILEHQNSVPKTVHLRDEVTVQFSMSLKIGDCISPKKPTWQPSVKIVHGHRQVEIPKHTCKNTSEDQWVIGFYPVVAGCHSITITSETDFAGKKISDKMDIVIKVKEKNSIQTGDKVEKGPDWNDEDDIPEVGVVKSVAEDCSVIVEWAGREGCYKWGQNGHFQVQLKQEHTETEATLV